MVFIALYCIAAAFALLASVYLLWRRVNAIADDVRSSHVLRQWTAAFMVAIAASHVWWYVIGTYWLTDDWLVRTITVILLDFMTLIPLVMGVLLAMLQDRRRPLWPWIVAQVPMVVVAIVGIARRSWLLGYEMAHLWQLAVIVVFVLYYINALKQYRKWLLDNYADLDHKEVWQSLVFVIGLFVVYEVYTSNAGEMMKEYLSQIITIVIIAFLVWRAETLQELDTEETEETNI